MSYREPDEARCIISAGRVVRAIELDTGATLWENADFGDAAAGALVATPERVYLAGWRQIGAIDARTGRTVWRKPSSIRARPAMLREADRLLLGGSGMVECFSLDGELVYRHEIPGANSVTLAIDGRVASDDRE